MSIQEYTELVDDLAKLKGITKDEAADIIIIMVKKFEAWRKGENDGE